MPLGSQSSNPISSLPMPPRADQLNIGFLASDEGKQIVAAYMQAVYALANGNVVVIYQGKTLPARAVKLAGPSAVFEVFVSSS